MRATIEILQKRFDVLNRRWLTSLEGEGNSAGSLARIVRSAAKVEQAFGGLNAQLWDDPFEWTLPEALDSRKKTLEYLEEVSRAVSGGFARLASDDELERELWTPWGQMTIRALFARTLELAEGILDTE